MKLSVAAHAWLKVVWDQPEALAWLEGQIQKTIELQAGTSGERSDAHGAPHPNFGSGSEAFEVTCASVGFAHVVQVKNALTGDVLDLSPENW